MRSSKKEAVDCVHARHRHCHKKYGDINLYTSERDRLDQEIKDAQARGDSAEEAKLTAERDLMQRRIDDINSSGTENDALNRADTLSRKRCISENMVMRERTFELQRAIFPDKNGATFNSDRERNAAISVADSRGYNSPIRDSFKFLDMVAKCYNTGGRQFVESKELVFFDFPRNNQSTVGDYNPWNNTHTIRMNSNHFRSNGSFPSNTTTGNASFLITHVHESGHGIVLNNLGADREIANVDWMKTKTGNGIISFTTLSGDTSYKVAPSAKQPTLLWRDYSYTVYSESARSSTIPGTASRFRMTEIFSTGMEAFVYDPEAFLRGFPLHANLILDNLKGLR